MKQEPNELTQIKHNNLSSNITDINDKVLTLESYIEIVSSLVDHRTNLKHKTNVDVLFLTLSYTNTSKYEWNVTKTLKSFKDFLSHIQYEVHFHSIPQPSDDFLNVLGYLRSCDFNQLIRQTDQITSFLNKVTSCNQLNNIKIIKEFFEVSSHSFVPYNNGVKIKEGYIMKQSEFNTCQVSCISLCKCFEKCCCSSWVKCWFLLKDDMLCYIDDSESSIGKYTFWFDETVTLTLKNTNIVLKNRSKVLQLKFENDFDCNSWHNHLHHKISNHKMHSKENDLKSFANVKHECKARFYIDGEDYFKDLHSFLLKAKETVFITDWWLSPEVYLTRPVTMEQFNKLEVGKCIEVKDGGNAESLSRLCDVLNHIAQKGVRVYILVFGEFALALTLNSKHTKNFLTSLHPNIQVTRHPKNSFDLLWSHHEKLVIVDQRYAFVGGLDLCWGRYDNTKHILEEKENEEQKYMFPGIDFSNARVADFNTVDNYLKETEDRKMPRMPWHDIHSLVQGPVVLDISRHFVERWNFSNSTSAKGGITDIKTKYLKESRTKFFPSNNEEKEAQNEKEKQPKKMHSTAKANIFVNAFGLNKAIEEVNAREEGEEKKKKKKEEDDMNNSKQAEEQNFEEIKVKEKPSVFANLGLSVPKTGFKKALAKRFNLKEKRRQSTKPIVNWVNLSVFETKFQRNETPMTCQALRSLCDWSCGLDITEHSILNGYYDLIDKAQHYIYIENQFFVSKAFTNEEYTQAESNVSDLIFNEIALHLRKRIERAAENKEKFKVFIFIPLLPGFAGDVTTSSTLQVILKYTYKTISRNKGLSLVEKLSELLGEEKVAEYITFYSLRQHALVNEIPRTELIYIHSKMMIVDDLYVIMGSANINDRSMLGERDSEFAVIYREEPRVKSKMNYKEYKASAFARNLRMKLMAEHLGIDYSDTNTLGDPLNDELSELLMKTANNNTKAYRDIFNCYPDDNMLAFKDIPINNSLIMTHDDTEKLKERYEANKGIIKGHIVEFPLKFLSNEILQRSFFSAEMLVPIKNFV